MRSINHMQLCNWTIVQFSNNAILQAKVIAPPPHSSPILVAPSRPPWTPISTTSQLIFPLVLRPMRDPFSRLTSHEGSFFSFNIPWGIFFPLLPMRDVFLFTSHEGYFSLYFPWGMFFSLRPIRDIFLLWGVFSCWASHEDCLSFYVPWGTFFLV